MPAVAFRAVTRSPPQVGESINPAVFTLSCQPQPVQSVRMIYFHDQPRLPLNFSKLLTVALILNRDPPVFLSFFSFKKEGGMSS